MEIIEKEVTPLEMLVLLRKGVLLEFQVFLNGSKDKKQIYCTKAASRGILYVCYHSRPFSFMVSNLGRVFNEQTALNFQNKSC